MGIEIIIVTKKNFHNSIINKTQKTKNKKIPHTVSIKPIYLNKHMFSRVSLQL